MNNVGITGRLTRTVEVRQTNTGKQVLSFAIAVDEFSNGTKRANFFDVVAFDKPNLVPYLLKGQLVGITGRLRQNRWEAPDGSNRSRVEIVAYNIDLLGGAKKESEQPQQEAAQSAPPTPTVDASIYDEDIPF